VALQLLFVERREVRN